MHHQRRKLVGAAALALGLMACESEEVYTAELNGANEAPNPVTTTATGTATFTLIDNTTLTFALSVSDIDSVTAAHIHVGEAGVPGGVIVNLFLGPTTGLDFTGSLSSGTITAATGMSFDSLLTRMRNGTLYTNVHTRVNGGGEIRGQITLQQ